MKPFRLQHCAIAATITASLLLGACSSDDDDDDNAPDPGPDPGTSTPSPTIDQVPLTLDTGVIGTVLIDRETRSTLYTRPGDAPGTVTCTDDCAATFPPLLTDVDTPGISGDFDILDTDGERNQWTFLGYPLHTHAGDAAEGDINGQGVDDEWYVARPIPITSGDSADGEVLAASGTILTGTTDPAVRNDVDGYTLYTFDDDTDGVSNCNDACADTWPPLHADIGAVSNERYTVIDRADGSRQWTFQGAPLYTYSGDSAPAQLNGNDIPGWSAVTQ